MFLYQERLGASTVVSNGITIKSLYSCSRIYEIHDHISPVYSSSRLHYLEVVHRKQNYLVGVYSFFTVHRIVC